ncbi:hypothetical protein DYU05_06375 [Mucilaginibacter terrenus]|uniref:histidine kinase n=1 Tax=Mucilaginibacter terrenus TaxID=2482727 RepID=A0A3E2NW34_9SPHI|nr:histidine kinase dimerization/phosphoacceptor domain -containing protein [Mucilaginibacter terrenus]RFZ85224.1 hypothetical protein DYU05_06375 [Mucilaginibacter terrenus]
MKPKTSLYRQIITGLQLGRLSPAGSFYGISTYVSALLLLLTLSSRGQALYPMNGSDLKGALKLEKTDTAKIRLYQKLRKFYAGQYLIEQKKVYLDSAIGAIKKAVELSEKDHEDSLKYQSLKYLGLSYIQAGDTLAAKRCQALAERYFLTSRHFDLAIKSWIGFGEAADRMGLYTLGMSSYRKAISLFFKHPAAGNEANIRYHIAQEYFLLKNPAEGEKEALAIVAKFKNKNINLDQANVFLAAYYRTVGDYRRALKYCLASVRDVEKFSEINEPDYYYGELALIYDALGESENCIKYYKKTLELRTKTAIEEEFLFRTAGFIIKNFIKLGKISAALNQFTTLRKEHPPRSPIGKIFDLQNQAYCEDATGKSAIAERLYLRVIDKLTSLQLLGVRSLAYEDLSNFYLTHHRFDEAKMFAEKMGTGSDLFENKRFEFLRFKIDSTRGDDHSALGHYLSFTKLRDSITNESKNRDIAELQLQYETDKKENDIRYLKKSGDLQKKQLKQARLDQNLILGGSSVLLILLVLLYRSYRINKSNTIEIDQKNKVLNLTVGEKDELLKEKEWLIKEVHHRVKNNLQIVMGLLQRQSSFINNKDALSAIKNSEQRMNSVALIHQKLYQSDNVMTVNMAEYIEELLGYLASCFNLDGAIIFQKDIDCIELEVNVAVPVGLILNEAVTNSIKYAFRDRNSGIIKVLLKKAEAHKYLLSVSDNGDGLPANFDLQQIHSMGFNLMKGLSKQIGGNLKIFNKEGLEIRVEFVPCS